MKIEIRSTHPYGFRSGTWAEILGVEWKNDRPCFKIMFPEDRFVDWWPVHDEWDPYEFRKGPDLSGQDHPVAGDGLSRWADRRCTWTSPLNQSWVCNTTEQEHDGAWGLGHHFTTGQNS